MNNILIFESFISKKISSLLRYLNKAESNKIINDLRDVMMEHNYPISNMNDVNISYNKTRDALELIPESGFYLKYWFDRNGNFISKTITKPEKINFLAIKPREIISTQTTPRKDYPKPKDYQYLYSHKSNTKSSEYFDWFKEGDGVYILCCSLNDYSPGQELPRPVEAKIYIATNGVMYAIQDSYDGTYPSGPRDLWRKYGQNSWYIADPGTLGGDHVIIAVEKPKGSMLFNSNNLDINEYEPKSDKFSLDYDYILNDSDFAITIKLSDLISKEESLSDIKKERETRKLGATSLMSNDEIIKSKRRK